MKKVFIPDIHQDLTTFNKIMAQQWPEDTVFVCLGDYVDTWGPKATEEEVKALKAECVEHLKTQDSDYCKEILKEYLSGVDAMFNVYFKSWMYSKDNYQLVGESIYKGSAAWFNDPFHSPVNIIARLALWHKEDPEHRILLIGNHDWAYFPGADNRVSGHQHLHEVDIRSAFMAEKDCFQVVYQDDEIIASHAGVSEEMLKDVTSMNSDIPFGEVLNAAFQANEVDLDHRGLDPSGNSNLEYCLWIRPAALVAYNAFKSTHTQVVGHTEVKCPHCITYTNGKPLWIVDTAKHDCFLVEEDGKFTAYSFEGDNMKECETYSPDAVTDASIERTRTIMRQRFAMALEAYR